jgi:predicted Fe-S protein YdhL (DUF1289 family)
METPCVNICVIDPVTGWCIGCGRTGGEIGAWMGMTPGQRRETMARLPERLAGMTTREARQPRQRQRTRA